MPFPKKITEKKLLCDLRTENRVLFFEENWNLTVKAVAEKVYREIDAFTN